LNRSIVWATALVGSAWALPPEFAAGQQFEPVPIRGQVLDAATERPVSGAVVRFMAGPGTTVTDTAGMFTLSLPPDGRYPLRIEQLGYETTFLVLPSTAPIELSTLFLTAKPLELEGIEVTVDRFAARRRMSLRRARVMDAGALTSALGGTFDVVMRAMIGGRPCITDGDRICKLRRGERGVSVCVDDRSMYRHRQELDRYQPSDLYLIEVYDDDPPFSVRIYTRDFVAGLASGARFLRPWRWGCSG
jgi:hypothetical protein